MLANLVKYIELGILKRARHILLKRAASACNIDITIARAPDAVIVTAVTRGANDMLSALVDQVTTDNRYKVVRCIYRPSTDTEGVVFRVSGHISRKYKKQLLATPPPVIVSQSGLPKEIIDVIDEIYIISTLSSILLSLSR